MFKKENSGQTSAELILLMAGIIIIVIMSMEIYYSYNESISNNINNTEIVPLLKKIDNLNNYLK